MTPRFDKFFYLTNGPEVVSTSRFHRIPRCNFNKLIMQEYGTMFETDCAEQNNQSEELHLEED